MLKRRQRHGSRMVLKRHRHPTPTTSVEWLPHDVVELILERLPVKSLMRFRLVSKEWRMTVRSQRFKERQFVRRRLSRGPDVLFVSSKDPCEPTQIVYGADEPDIVLGSSSSSILRKVSLPFDHLKICLGSCDGLLCIHCDFDPSVVVNPATQWHRTIPFSCVEELIVDKIVNKREISYFPPCKLGFGKDIIRGTYKAVWLYNSSDFGLDKDGSVTTCEVFDFSTNSWRYLAPSSPYEILPYLMPVYLDGSLYWITDCFPPKVLSFHLHTETFKVISDSEPPLDYCLPEPLSVVLCILDNRLCISEKTEHTQKIWSFSSSSGTWKNMCSIDLTEVIPSCFSKPFLPTYTVAILEKNKLLVHGRHYLEPAVLVDLHTKSYDLVFKPTTFGYSVYYFESLFSF